MDDLDATAAGRVLSVEAAFELIGAASIVLAFVFLAAGRGEPPGRAARLAIGTIMAFTLFFHLGNVMEWGGITPSIDPIEDSLWVLLPVLWGFFFYICGQESLALRLRESEDRYRSLVELSPLAIFVRSGGEIVYANPAAARLLDAGSPEHLVGVPLRSLFGDDLDGAGVVAARETTLRKGMETRDVEIAASPIQFLGAEAQQLIVHDISARKRTERTLKTGARVLESMVEGVCLTDEDGTIVYTNPAQDAMFGWGPRELLGRNVREIQRDPATSGEDGFEKILEGVRSRGTWVGELANRRKDGSAFTSYARVTEVNVEGKTSLLCVAEDLSERKLLEEQLIQAQKMESVGRLAGGIAHDFNNLLTVIVGSTEVALTRAAETKDARGPLKRVLESADRAAELTRRLLAFARKQPYSPVVLSLNECVAEAETMLQRLIGEDVDLRTRLETSLWCVKADRGQIMQVLVNLAVNARDAMPGGGELDVATRNHRFTSAVDGHPLMAPGEYVSLTVADSGTGMTDEVQRHLFEPFFTTKEPGQGTGLGLATCYGIVKQNGGFIFAKSAVGRGSSFTVYLPRALGEPAVVEDRPPARWVPEGRERVLLVEDEPTVRAVVVQVLEALGYEVLEARDGEEALALARDSKDARSRIDLLITDVVMPRMGGLALAERLIAELPGLPVLYISGYPARGAGYGGRLDRNAVLLEKPFTPQALASKVREVLERARV
jgi:PAS domain S-box-containing protein